MTSVRRTQGTPKELEIFRDAQAAVATQKNDELKARKENAAQRLEASPLAAAWKQALAEPWDQTTALYTLLEEVHPWGASGLKSAEAEQTKQAALVHSLDALFARLAEGINGGAITPENARFRHDQRVGLLGSIGRVKRAVEAAGAQKSFPMKQLGAIERRLSAELNKLVKTAEAGSNPVQASVWFKTPEDTQQPGREIGRVFNDLGLGAKLDALVSARPNDKELRGDLAALAMLGDELSTAPDYSKTGKGWFHPSSRRDYRMRTHDTFSRYLSADRQKIGRDSLKADLEKVAAGELSADQVLVSTFLRELGLKPEEQATFKPTAAGIRAALVHELFLPLRALSETRGSMNKGNDELTPHVDKAVRNILAHVVAGDYREWRLENETGQKQLSGLDAGQLESWKTRLNGESQHHGVTLKTREEDGLDLFWVTKIGGPSHGFDYGGECLLPLLSNARTRAILVDDPRWPHNASARSYLRLLHLEDGKPTLYLEPFQRDFPHRDAFGHENDIDRDFYAAIMKHALSKAEAMGLPLSIGQDYEHIAASLDLKMSKVEDKLLLRASNGVYEASDTLSDKHDWAQMQDEVTNPLRRILISRN
jgi:hypothetical protein